MLKISPYIERFASLLWN